VVTLVDGTRERPALLTMAGRLVGRADELDVVLDRLADPDVRTVMLTGPSGVGKTRLALAACAASRVERRVFVPLSGVQESEVMADAIVAAVGAEAALSERPADALWRHHAGAPVLVLLDNLEQVDDAASVISELLDDYPGVIVLATSLRAVGLPGLQTIRLGPLRVPDDEVPAATGALAPALEMFLSRVLMGDVTATPSDSDLRAAATICRAVGGLPLAIELAAARASSVPLSLMAAQLSEPAGLRLLDQPSSGAPGRHRSLRAALAWTVDLLPPGAADLLATMSVLAGQATLETVASLWPADGALDVLSALIDVSLVDVDAGDPHEPLFSLLPPVRAFARERLERKGRGAEAVQRLDQYVRARCRSGPGLRPHEMADVLASLDRALLDGSTDAALELALQAARVATAPGARASLATRVEELLERPGHDAVLTARALAWSVSHLPAGVPDQEAFAGWTLGRVREAIRGARRSGDRAALLDALELTIRTLPLTLDLGLAKAGIEEGLAIAQEHGDESRLARFQMWAGMASLAEGLVEPALELLHAAFIAGTAAGDRVAADYAATFLRAAGVERSGLDQPLPQLATLLDSAWRHHDAWAAAIVLGQLVNRALSCADIKSAAELTLRLLHIGAGRVSTEPLPAATILTVGVRLLVAADRLTEAAAVQAPLAALDPLLRNALSRAEYLAYVAAVDRLDGIVATASGPALPPSVSLRDAFRLAERAIVRVTTAADASAPDLRPSVDWAGPAGRLTARERQVLSMLTEGSGNRQIADALGISSKTVMHHTVSIYRKLGVRGRAEAAVWAARAGMAADG
jgi:predicted ATPase/DNA-binding CsgD family transcriptional regulator